VKTIISGDQENLTASGILEVSELSANLREASIGHVLGRLETD
jgi:hypothetical protein